MRAFPSRASIVLMGSILAVPASTSSSSSVAAAVLPRVKASNTPVFAPMVEEGAQISAAHFDAYFPAVFGAQVPGVEFGDDFSTVTIFVGEWWGLDAATLRWAQRASATGGAFALNQFRSSEVPVQYGSVQAVTDAVTVSAYRMRESHWLGLVDDIQSIVNHYRTRGAKKVGLVGWSYGGCLALLAAQHVTGLDAVAAIYGSPDDSMTKASQFFDASLVTTPTFLIVGSNDPFNFSKASRFRELHDAVRGSELFIADGGDHAFMADTAWWEAWKAAQHPPRAAYNASMAEMAWTRVTHFLAGKYARSSSAQAAIYE